ncbi:MAG: c-type cytochrome domain-containing protein [Planctomycetota bacterium]
MRRSLVAIALLAGVVWLADGARAQDKSAPADGAKVSFEKDVLPIFEMRCFECHAIEYQRRPKGRLRLDGKEWILRGGKGGSGVVPGEPNESAIYMRVTLPEEHEDIMPPDGAPVSKAQKETLRRWIEEGAEFGDWDGIKRPKPKPAAKTTGPDDRFTAYEALSKDLDPVPSATIAKVAKTGARIEAVVPGSPLLRVEFVTGLENGTDEAVKALAPLRNNIAILSLAQTRITDGALDHIAKMPRLYRLDLQRTAITDKALETLAKQKPTALTKLNVYGTGVTDRGLAPLATITSLRALYLWQTKVTDAGVKMLSSQLPECRIQNARPLPAAAAPRQNNNRRRRGQN